MSDAGRGGQDPDPFGPPPTGPGDFPDPSQQQSAFPLPPGQQPPPGQYAPPAPPGQQPAPGQYAPPGQQVSPPFEPPVGQYQPPPAGYGQQGYGVPPAGYPPAVAQKKRKIWPWFLLGLPVLFIMLIGGCTLLVYNLTTGPIDATNVHVANLDNGDFEAAYQNLCERLKADVSPEVWIDQTRADLGGEITGYTYASSQVTNGSALVTGTIVIDGLSRASSFNLVLENGEWRVCR